MTSRAEHDSWAGETGRTWARRQEDLDRLMAGVTDLLLAKAALRPGDRVLDVGCGAGASTLAAARAIGPAGQVTGVDLSAPLLAIARSRAITEGLAQARFLEADAATGRFLALPFDALISRFGTMFFDDPVAAFSNLAGQLAPGATLTFVAWAAAHENPWFAVPHRLAEARLGSAPPSDPDAPGPTAFRDPARVTALLARSGLDRPEAEAATLELHHSGGAAALSGLALDVGPAARLMRLRGGTEEDRLAIERGIEAALSAFAAADGIRVPARVIVYRARTP